MPLGAEVLKQEGNYLQLKFMGSHSYDHKFLTFESELYLCGSIAFQIKVQSARCHAFGSNTIDGNIIISTKYQKVLKNDNLTYICKISSVAFNKKSFTFSDNDIWYQLYHYSKPDIGGSTNNTNFTFTFDIAVEIDLAPTISPFTMIYEETDSPDFELHSVDGSVKMHKFILKVASPVLHEMVNGQWKEASEGQVKLDINKDALEAFKDYIYLNKLPSTQTTLESLLLLGSYYMMTELVQKCTVKLLHTINNNNFSDLTEFAIKNNVKILLATIFTMIRLGLINTDDFTADTLEEISKSLKTVKKKT